MTSSYFHGIIPYFLLIVISDAYHMHELKHAFKLEQWNIIKFLTYYEKLKAPLTQLTKL